MFILYFYHWEKQNWDFCICCIFTRVTLPFLDVSCSTLLYYYYFFVLKTRNVCCRQSLWFSSVESLISTASISLADTFPWIYSQGAFCSPVPGPPLLLLSSSLLPSTPSLWPEPHVCSSTEPCPVHSLWSSP